MLILGQGQGLEESFRLYNGLGPYQALAYRIPAKVFHGEQGIVEEAYNGSSA